MISAAFPANLLLPYTQANAARLAGVAQRFQASSRLERGGKSVNARSVLGILAIMAESGPQVIITCDGADEQAALRALEQALSSGSGV